MPKTRCPFLIAGVATNYNVTPVSPFLIDAARLPWALAVVLLFGVTAHLPIYLLQVPLGLPHSTAII